MTRQVIQIDVTFEGSYERLKTQDILKILVEKYEIKNVSIKNIKKKGTK